MGSTVKVTESVSCDLLIVGAGGAGLRCASEVLERTPTAKVIALTKVAHPQKSHTSAAQGGLAVVDPSDPLDSPIFHMFDTWKGSDCTADQSIIKQIIECSWEQIAWLENRGMHFTRNQEGKLSKRIFGGHTLHFGQYPAKRAVFEADRTGKGIIDTTWGESIKRQIIFLTQTIATELLIDNNRCEGCIAFRQKTGEFLRISAKATVIASGGTGQVYKITTNCRQNTGDGQSLALKAGLPIMDPEAVQFHPTGIVGPGILASEAMRGEGGILRNKDDEPFMEQYAPKMKDLAPRDLVARAIETEIRQGRGIMSPSHGIEHVWIDLTHLPDYVHDVKLKEISGFFRKFANRNPKKELCPVRPSNHYHMGGIPTDENGRVLDAKQEKTERLFAIGECACASFHGFNRLATNSILELITMGKIVGQEVCKDLMHHQADPQKSLPESTSKEFNAFFEAKGKENIALLKDELRRTMTEKVGVFRTQKSLELAIDKLHELKTRADQVKLSTASLAMNQELVQRWEFENLLTVSLAIAEGALVREESRGGHYREDFPDRRDEFNHHTYMTMDDYGHFVFSERQIDMSIFHSEVEYSHHFGMIERKY